MKSSTSISVQWGPVEPCVDQNGAITGYSVRYGSERVPALGDSSGGIHTITGLTKETMYTVEVAADTSTGIRVFSEALTIETPDS